MCTICACSQSLSALELIGHDLRASRRQAEAVRPRLQAGAGFSLCTRLASHTGRAVPMRRRTGPAGASTGGAGWPRVCRGSAAPRHAAVQKGARSVRAPATDEAGAHAEGLAANAAPTARYCVICVICRLGRRRMKSCTRSYKFMFRNTRTRQTCQSSGSPAAPPRAWTSQCADSPRIALEASLAEQPADGGVRRRQIVARNDIQSLLSKYKTVLQRLFKYYAGVGVLSPG